MCVGQQCVQFTSPESVSNYRRIAGLKRDNVLRTFFRFRRLDAAAPAVRAFVVVAVALGILLGGQSMADAKSKYAGFVIDAKTGKVLYSKNADARRYPASLTKMMTLYLVFEDLKRRKIRLNTRVIMSRHAASQPPSKLGIKRGRSFSIKQGIYALVTKSANDVATALGEKLSGSEKAFAKRMTRKARQLGMRRTVFKNANGLPNRAQVTTARDMAKLGLALKEHFPREFRYFKTRSFAYGRKRYRNHNRLLGRVKGVDGIKTGYTRASGFNLVSSVSRGKRRIVAVVLGGQIRSLSQCPHVEINQQVPTSRIAWPVKNSDCAGPIFTIQIKNQTGDKAGTSCDCTCNIAKNQARDC